MFGLPILELAIGLSFVYLLLALICSTVNETIAALTSRRAAFLKNGIENMLRNPNLTKKILGHPLIDSLSAHNKPSYIPASKFALAMMDVLTGEGKPADDAAALREGASKVPTQHLKTALSTLLADSRSDLPTDQHKIEAWYQDAMDRVSGVYKRRTTLWLWVLAIVMTLVVNADTLRITRTLWQSQAVRTAVVEAAKARSAMERPEELLPVVEYKDPDDPNNGTPVQPRKSTALTEQEQALLGQLTGWSSDINDWRNLPSGKGGLWVLHHLLGWFLTATAVTLGAPFWFDMLSRLMNVRSAGRVPESQNSSR